MILPLSTMPTDETGQVVFAGLVHPRHFGGFAADQAHLACGSPPRCPMMTAVHLPAVEFAHGQVIEKKQGLGALNDECR